MMCLKNQRFKLNDTANSLKKKSQGEKQSVFQCAGNKKWKELYDNYVKIREE